MTTPLENFKQLLDDHKKHLGKNAAPNTD